MTWLHMQFVSIFITADSRALRKLFIFRSRSRSPGKPTSNISSIVKPAILREEPIPGSEQGNSLKGTDKKTGKREGKESIKRVFSQFLFSVTHSLQGKKMFGNCSLFLYIPSNCFQKKISKWKPAITNIVCKKWLLFQVEIRGYSITTWTR